MAAATINTPIHDRRPLPGSTKGEALGWELSTYKTGTGWIITTVTEAIHRDGFFTTLLTFGTASGVDAQPGAFSQRLAAERIKPATAKRLQAQHDANIGAARVLVAQRIDWLAAHPDVFKSREA